MGMQINNNIAAFNAYRNLSITQGAQAKSLEKLSSGYRINRAADDAAGLAMSEGLRSQIGGLKVATRNAQDGISVVQTAEGALNESHAILQRMRDLTVQAANSGATDDTAKDALNTEFTQLKTELTRIAKSTSFGKQALLSGGYDSAKGVFQIGWTSDSFNQIKVDLTSNKTTGVLAGTGLKGFDSTGLKLDSSSIGHGVSAKKLGQVLKALDSAITGVSTARANLGALQNRFEHTINNLNVSVENISASESRIRDTDMASEMVNFTRNQILSQAGTAMLAQAKNIPQGVLQLLQ
jgi:flagellin